MASVAPPLDSPRERSAARPALLAPAAPPKRGPLSLDEDPRALTSPPPESPRERFASRPALVAPAASPKKAPLSPDEGSGPGARFENGFPPGDSGGPATSFLSGAAQEWRSRLRSVAREEPPGLPAERCPSPPPSTWVQAALADAEGIRAGSLAELSQSLPARAPPRPEPPEAPPPADDEGPAGALRRAPGAAPRLAPRPARRAAPGHHAGLEGTSEQPPGAAGAAEALLGARLEESLARALDASLGPALTRALASAPLLGALRLAAAAAGGGGLQADGCGGCAAPAAGGRVDCAAAAEGERPVAEVCEPPPTPREGRASCVARPSMRNSRRASTGSTCSLQRSMTDALGVLEMWPVWREDADERADVESIAAYAKPAAAAAVDVTVSLRELTPMGRKISRGQTMELGRGWLVLHPSSTPIAVWYLLGPVLLLYDMVMTPLLLMPIRFHGDVSFSIMSQFITVYWTLDMLRCFVTGFETRKGIEMRPRHCAMRYLRSWFLMDLMVVSTDWTRFFLGGDDSVNSIGPGIGRAQRFYRIAQVGRLVRVIKVLERTRQKVDAIFSLGGLLLLRSLMFIVAFLFVCHFMACYWYDLANPASVESGYVQLQSTWLVQADMLDALAGEVYAVSFQWALSQSGFASSNIYASNWVENSFTTLCGFAWLAIVSMTIAYFSCWVQQYQETHKPYREKLAQIKLFLEEHKVSRALSYKVLRSFRWNFRLYNSRVHEGDVGYFRDLPKYMIGALRAEIYMPALRGHPFFGAVTAACGPGSVQAISNVAMREQHYSGGSNVFTEGLEAHHMFFVAQGDLEYYAVKLDMEARTLTTSNWAVEPALWMRWVFNGRLVSSTSSEVVTVEVMKVHAIAKSFGSDSGGIQILRKFAQELVSYFSDAAPLTDLWWDQGAIERIAWQVGLRTDAGLVEQPEGFRPIALLKNLSWRVL